MCRGVRCGLLISVLAVVQVTGIRLYNEGMEPVSPCSVPARTKDLQSCLQAIRKRAEDPSIFWFGNNYITNCRKGKRQEGMGKGVKGQAAHLADCFNPRGREGSDSLVSRLFSTRELDPQVLDRYLEVTFRTQPGSYKACENDYNYDMSREVTLDPLSMTVMTPYEVRAPPKLSWPADDGMLYTLLFYDVGYFTVKALYINIPGNKFDQGKGVVKYEGPLNPTRNNNPYVFLLFRQSGPITLDEEWQQILDRRDWEAELGDFMEAHKLKGPIALSWVLVYGDAYGAEVSRIRGYMNTCAHFVANAFQSQEIEFIPNKTYYGHVLQQLNVFINVTYDATPVAVNSCCNTYHYPARTFNLNPLGDAAVLPAHTRTDVMNYVTLHMATAFPDTQRDFKDKTLTLLMADPDVPAQAFGNARLPFNHWLVTNIRNGDVASGDVVQSYMGPAPPDPHPHRYYFLLFLQSGDLDPRRMDYSAANCSWDFRGRCRFDVMAMMSENDLQLIGVTWMVARFDEFVRELYVQSGMFAGCAACKGVPGYADPCPISALPNSSSWALKPFSAGLFVMLCLCLRLCLLAG